MFSKIYVVISHKLQVLSLRLSLCCWKLKSSTAPGAPAAPALNGTDSKPPPPKSSTTTGGTYDLPTYQPLLT